jgi:hypothetical protein
MWELTPGGVGTNLITGVDYGNDGAAFPVSSHSHGLDWPASCFRTARFQRVYGPTSQFEIWSYHHRTPFPILSMPTFSDSTTYHHPNPQLASELDST